MPSHPFPACRFPLPFVSLLVIICWSVKLRDLTLNENPSIFQSTFTHSYLTWRDIFSNGHKKKRIKTYEICLIIQSLFHPIANNFFFTTLGFFSSSTTIEEKTTFSLDFHYQHNAQFSAVFFFFFFSSFPEHTNQSAKKMREPNDDSNSSVSNARKEKIWCVCVYMWK